MILGNITTYGNRLSWIFGLTYCLLTIACFLNLGSPEVLMKFGFFFVVVGFVHNEAMSFYWSKIFVESTVKKMRTSNFDDAMQKSIESDANAFLGKGPLANIYRILPLLIGILLWKFNHEISTMLTGFTENMESLF